MRKGIVLFLLCLGGALLNIALNILIAGKAGLPLYLDTVLTISLTLGGAFSAAF